MCELKMCGHSQRMSLRTGVQGSWDVNFLLMLFLFKSKSIFLEALVINTEVICNFFSWPRISWNSKVTLNDDNRKVLLL